MNFSGLVASRASVRKYTDQPVPDELVMQLLEWAHDAPSGGNLRPWEFILIESAGQKQAVVETTFAGRDESKSNPQKWILTAPLVIAVCADLAKIKGRYGETSIWPHLPYLDCSAAVENILLGAVELGLASCYVSGFHEQELGAVLGLPEDVVPIALLPIGYAAESPARRPRGPVTEQIHRERY